MVDNGDVYVPTGWSRGPTPCDLLRPKWAGEFRDFNDWVSFATHRLDVGKSHPPAMCVDTLGRRCWIGKHFIRARDEGTFPVRYFFECEPVEAPESGSEPADAMLDAMTPIEGSGASVEAFSVEKIKAGIKRAIGPDGGVREIRDGE